MKKIIFLAIISFIIFVLIKAPASILLPYINKSPYFQVQSIAGNIFSAQITTTGNIDSLSYQINPWQLLLANLSADVQIKKGSNNLQSIIMVNLITQTVKMKNTIGVINLAFLQKYITVLSAVEPRGALAIQGLDGTWNDIINNQIPQQLSGNVELLKLNALGQNFGDYQLVINTQKANIIGLLNNKPSATTNTDIKFNLTDTKKQLSISGNVVGNNANTKAILKQLGIINIKQTIQY